MGAGRRGKPAEWDKALGRRLWDEGKSQGEICRACGIHASSLRGWAARNWPARVSEYQRQQAEKPAAPRQPRKPAPLKPGARTLPGLDSLK